MTYHYWCRGCGAPDDHGCTCPPEPPKERLVKTGDGGDWAFVSVLLVVIFAVAAGAITDLSSKPKPIPDRIAPTTCLHTK